MNIDLRNIDIINELSQRGYEGKVSNQNLMICCPYHGESNPSFGIRIDFSYKRGLFQCWSCGENGNLIKLLSYLDECSIYTVLDKLRSQYIDEIKLDDIIDLYNKKFNNYEYVKIYDELILEKFKEPYDKYKDYLIDRGIIEEYIDIFNIKCCDKGVLSNRIIIPIYDEKNRLISYDARSIYGRKPKAIKLKDSDSKHALFGLNNIEEITDYIVIVEGEFDAIYLQQYGYNAIALLGIIMSSIQFDKLTKLDIDNIYIMFDGDVYEDEFKYKNLCQIYSKLSNYFFVKKIKIDCDPDELSYEDLQIKLKDVG